MSTQGTPRMDISTEPPSLVCVTDIKDEEGRILAVRAEDGSEFWANPRNLRALAKDKGRGMTRSKAFQAKHIDDRAVLKVVSILQQKPTGTASRWDIVDAFKPIPWKIVQAKLTALKRKGLVDGCVMCTCRGSFELTEKGRVVMEETDGETATVQKDE